MDVKTAHRAAAADRAEEMAQSAAGHDFTRGIWVPPAIEAKGPRNDGLQYVDEQEAFPNVQPLCKPLGNLVQIMLRVPKLQTIVGLHLVADNERQTERDNTQVGKVSACGPLAFRNRNTYEVWPEGAWCQPGDYVRVPKFHGDVQVVKYFRTIVDIDHVTEKRTERRFEDRVLFVLFKDLDIRGRYDSAADALAEEFFV